MFLFKVLPVLLLAFLAQASDLETALQIMACAQRAIKNGVPELGIPSHSPVEVKRNFTWTGDIDVASASLLFHDIIWAGLPDWEVSGTQLSDDADAVVELSFKIYWKTMNIYGAIDANFTELLLVQQFTGNISTDWSETTWAGTIKVTKPGFNKTEEVNDLDISWVTEDLTTTTEGFGLFGPGIQTLIDLGLPAALKTDQFSATMSQFLKARLNTVWWSTGKIWELTDWCQNNTSTTTSTN